MLAMAATMTVPMVGWMRYCGHGWRANTEMSASMLVPTFAAIALLEASVVDDIGVLLVVEHIAMLLACSARCSCAPPSTRTTTRTPTSSCRRRAASLTDSSTTRPNLRHP